MGFLQCSTLRPVPDHDKLHRTMALLHSAVCRNGECDVFLWRHPPDVEHGELTLRQTPHAPQCHTATLRGKQPTVDAAPQDTDIAHAHGLQLVAESDAGHEGAVCTVMKPAEIAPDQGPQPAQTVVLGIAVEIGVKTTKYRNLQALVDAHRGPSERPLRGHVHHIWTVLRPAVLEQPACWYANMDPLVSRQR